MLLACLLGQGNCPRNHHIPLLHPNPTSQCRKLHTHAWPQPSLTALSTLRSRHQRITGFGRPARVCQSRGSPQQGICLPHPTAGRLKAEAVLPPPQRGISWELSAGRLGQRPALSCPTQGSQKEALVACSKWESPLRVRSQREIATRVPSPRATESKGSQPLSHDGCHQPGDQNSSALATTGLPPPMPGTAHPTKAGIPSSHPPGELRALHMHLPHPQAPKPQACCFPFLLYPKAPLFPQSPQCSPGLTSSLAKL